MSQSRFSWKKTKPRSEQETCDLRVYKVRNRNVPQNVVEYVEKIFRCMLMALINRKYYEIQRSWHNLRQHLLITSVLPGGIGEKCEGQSASREVRSDSYKYVKAGSPVGCNNACLEE